MVRATVGRSAAQNTKAANIGLVQVVTVGVARSFMCTRVMLVGSVVERVWLDPRDLSVLGLATVIGLDLRDTGDWTP